MGVALGKIGMLAALAGIVMFIVALVRKSGWGVVRSLAIGGVGLVLVIVGTVVGVTQEATESTSTPVPQETPAPTLTPEPSQLITKDASELVLTIDDFPAGWKLQGEGTTDEGYFKRTFIRIEFGSPEPLVSHIKVFSTINEAKEEYTAQLSQIAGKYSYDKLKAGDESFAYEEVGWGFRSLFRDKNVIGIIDMSTLLHGGSLYEV